MNILLVTDGSEGATDAAHFLAGFAPSLDTHLHILTIRRETAGEAGCAEKAEAIFAATRTALGGFAGQITTNYTQTRLATSRIVERIQVAAEMLPADLVVTGSRGHSRVAHFFLGSVALGIARHSPCSVLIGRAPNNALKRVVIGIDDSEDSLGVVCFLKRLSIPSDCAIHLVYVAISSDMAAQSSTRLPASVRHAIASAVHDGQEEGRQRLNEAAQELHATGSEITTEVRYGDPVTELLGVANGIAKEQKPDADLLVVGARRRSPLEEYFLGSVSSPIIELAHCSVLVVRG